MSLLFRIVYAAHANGTHHKLALDALTHLQRPDAEAWCKVFLKHVELYLEGSKAPDKSFKDFKNHVLHVGDNYWGGAPEKVEAWYNHTVAALRAENWADAAYAAGVLSHYYTDPIHPFHTGQTEAENAIHRAVEWSINKSYNRLRAMAVERHSDLTVTLPSGAQWAREASCDAAEFSHRYYETLISQYDFAVGASRPEEGFNEIGNRAIAELLMYAAVGFSGILDRALNEAGVAPPHVNLTAKTFLATVQIPARWIEKKLANAEDRAIVQAMFDEQQAFGRVEHSLPEDDRTIRDLHHREVLMPRLSARQAERAKRIPEGDPADRHDAAKRAALSGTVTPPPAPAADATSPPATPTRPTVGLPRDVRDAAFERREPQATDKSSDPSDPSKDAAPETSTPSPTSSAPLASAMASIHFPSRTQNANNDDAPAVQSITSSSEPDTGNSSAGTSGERTRRSYLALSDDLEAAPSIGPKMAQRFADIGVLTVDDFLGQDPFDLAEQLDDRRFDGDTLTDWQDQAQLVIDIPGLRGTHAQLLVGAGYRTLSAVAESDAASLAADVLAFATSSDGKRVLRDGNPPDVEKIKGWLEAAQNAEAA